ncbi:MFS transporter [Catenuloplanes japonicus]|uniref:MFS transporter n=1 Tax=Catenuloplanes japonicus TaxID=33876 RepID=UPI0005251868|nr:MFS transporter [Catenuloplanes japonicus]
MVIQARPDPHGQGTKGLGVAAAAGGAFAGFYCLYSAAPAAFAAVQPSAGVRVAGLMVVVILAQVLVLIPLRHTRSRGRIVQAGLLGMAAGPLMTAAGADWAGLALLGIGFGVFVVTSTAWARELASSGRMGSALGAYGFGSAIGGAVGSPAGAWLVAHTGSVGAFGGATGFVLAGAAALVVARRRGGSAQAVTAMERPFEARSVTDAALEPRRPAGASPTASRRPRIGLAAVLAAHLLAVTAYAAVLSSAGSLAGSGPVVAAFLTQAAVALGRVAGGRLSDRLPPARVITAGLALVAPAGAGFLTATAPVVLIATMAVVGAVAGAVQTAALTGLMRGAGGPAGTVRAGAAWNITFDLGLGVGALLAVH